MVPWDWFGIKVGYVITALNGAIYSQVRNTSAYMFDRNFDTCIGLSIMIRLVKFVSILSIVSLVDANLAKKTSKYYTNQYEI